MLCSCISNIAIYKSAGAEGAFRRQSFRLTSEGSGCFMLLFGQILKGVVVYRPVVYASNMVMYFTVPL
jgi:hypothetical protein